MKKSTYVLITLCGVLLFAGGFCLLRLHPSLGGMAETLPYLLIGVGCGVFGYGLGELLSRLAKENDPAMAKQLEIEAKDERNVMLGNAAKAKGFDMATYVYSALLLSYALMKVSVSVIIPFVIVYLLVQFYALYRRFQLEKVL